ncbi:hypothetical protein [Capnocytophaga felis]|uniref:Lipoprotein n=1 Tax=Capnocytophaga felis TaxID=2267611 RepID=A0A5M4B7B7_9FLAO|nr:hypothetical protein [Capnocytophaga felis]GET45175.1 hypothetical protein RCZ01_04770 [Capnocytophaga felis]GET47661.1 hypothetical protein RCZ02_04920 [Capnocytophaga felis]
MKKIFFYLCISLFTLIGCNNKEETPTKQKDKEATKERIRNILISNGVDESSIHFFDATEADKKNAIVISSLEEFEQMMKEGRKRDSISRKEYNEFLKRRKADSINRNNQKKSQ